jgi:hypothetical protein
MRAENNDIANNDIASLAPRNYVVHWQIPLLGRFVGKFVVDILPAALASVIGGFLFTQYQVGRTAPPRVEQASPASTEVLALVRDEHEAILGYLKSQMAAEKNRLAAQDAETAQAVADAKAAQEAAQEKAAQEKVAQEKAAQEKVAQEKATLDSDAREKAGAESNTAEIKLTSAPSARRVAPSMQARVAVSRAKPVSAPATAAPAPLVIAQAEPNAPQNDVSASTNRLASDPDSLLAKTLDLKDHVVAATRRAAAAIGDVFTSVGERISGATPSTRQFSSDS